MVGAGGEDFENFSKAQEIRFAMVYLKRTTFLWNKRCNRASCSTLSKAEKAFCQKIFFVQQKSGGGHG